MTVFISGGAKNGKSDFAQELAVRMADGGTRYYIATMIPMDDEDHRRIQKHLDSRAGMGFETIECGRNILTVLQQANPQASFLLDSATALLMNEIFPPEKNYEMDVPAAMRCAEDLAAFVRAVDHAVIVSDAIYTDAAVYDESTETYRRCLAHIDRVLARECDVVVEFVSGSPIVYKGELLP